MNRLERYRNGECRQVWDEIRGMGLDALKGATRDEVWEIACETMRRARANLELIYEKLKKLDYEFYDYPRRQRLTANEVLPSSVRDKGTVVELEAKIGRLPLTFRAWFELVGGVNFMGRFPDPEVFGNFRYLDPVILVGAEDLLQEVKFEEKNGLNLAEFVPTLAPDKFIKIGEAGGPCFGELGERSADFVLKADADWLFTDYLRHVFDWGGFPGIALAPNDALRSRVEFLKADLLKM